MLDSALREAARADQDVFDSAVWIPIRIGVEPALSAMIG
jgi:hypothetical protein